MAITDPGPPLVAPTLSAEIGKPDTPPVASSSPASTDNLDGEGIDTQWIELVLTDAERAEKDFRSRGREITAIYRNEGKGGGSPTGKTKGRAKTGTIYNVLYANTEVMLPAIYQKPPQPAMAASPSSWHAAWKSRAR